MCKHKKPKFTMNLKVNTKFNFRLLEMQKNLLIQLNSAMLLDKN